MWRKKGSSSAVCGWVRRADSGVTTLHGGLESDTTATRGLFSVAVTLGILSLLFLVLDLVYDHPMEEPAGLADPGILSSLAGIVLFLVVSFLYFLYRKGRLGADRFLLFGAVYQVVICFGVSYGELCRPGSEGLPLSGLSFVSIIIVLFPMFVPVSLRRTLLVSLAAATTGPLAAFLYHAVHSGSLPPAGIFQNYIAGYVVIWVVGRTAKQINIMSRRMVEARRMGSYELKELLGHGGMGEVWRGNHRMLRRPAAIKLIRPEALGSKESDPALVEARFEREAQATAGLHSPHTIQLYDFGRTDDGTFFYVMELLDGIDLDSLVRRFGPQPAGRVVSILRQACDSLRDAHLSGMVHRDIKPANLYLCRYGHEVDFVKVLDFGLVKERGKEDAASAQLTGEGVIAGTPAFLSPEAARDGNTDGRSDIYSLGCVAYWLLTGSLVFERETPMQTLIAHIREDVTPPSVRTEIEIPGELEKIILAMLEKDPERRPGSAEELSRLLARSGVEEEWTAERARRWWETHRPGRAG